MDDHHDDNFPPPTTSNAYDLNSRLMLTAIISLTFVVSLVTILHIYARCVLRRRARHRSAIRRLGLAVSQLQQTSSEPPKTGLDRSVIASLPVFFFKQIHTNYDETRTIECAVCLSIFEDDEMARLLPNCKHTFHTECIDRWLSSNSTCPICRTEAKPSLLLPEPCEAVVGAPPVRPTAPPLEGLTNAEGTSDGGLQSSAKVGGSSSRLSSFRRMLSRDRSSRRIQSCGQVDGQEDIERQ